MGAEARATVYVASDGSFRIVADDRTPMGVVISRADVDLVNAPTNEELGARVLGALASAGRLVAHPNSQKQWSTLTRSFVQAMGYRSNRQLMSVNVAVVVSRERDAVLIVPTDNLGPRGGYSHRPDRSRVVAAKPGDVGEAIRDAVQAVAPT
jgi:hypothetical protein